MSSSLPKTHWRSIYLVSAIAFIESAQFSLYFTSSWPFLTLIDSTANETFFAYVVAAYSLGQMVASPIVGYWSNRIKQIKLPIIIGMILMVLGNISYISAEQKSQPKYFMLFSRFINGVGASITSLLRAYVSTASINKDRSKAIAYVTGGVSLGTIFGPAFQLLFSHIGYPGFRFIFDLNLSMYTAPAYFACLINICGLIAIILIFDEKYVEIVDDNENLVTKTKKLPEYDKLAFSLCFLTRFTQLFVSTNLETIGQPFSMTMFAWTKDQVVHFTSIVHVIMGAISFGFYLGYIVFNMGKFINQRALCMSMLMLLLFGHLTTFSWPFLSGHLKIYNNSMVSNSSADLLGCNSDQFSWCESMQPVNVWVYYISIILMIGIGFPNINVSLNTIFSQIIGPRRQGTQQGVLQFFGGFARMLGPVSISVLYIRYSPRAAWLFEIAIILITIVFWVFLKHRMVPLERSENVEKSKKRKIYAQ